MITKSHQFFILPERPWPVVSIFNAFNIFLAALLYLKFGQTTYLFLNIYIIFLRRIFWWNSFRGEFNLEGKNSLTIEQGLKYAIILFISSEIFFFFSFFWSYFHFFLSPAIEIRIIWPPLAVSIFDYRNVPLINTLILVRSGFRITIRHHYIIKGKIKKSEVFLFITVVLGLLFTILQFIEYKSSFFEIRDGSFGRGFFMLTGFHGIHVIIGTIFLLISLYRFRKMTPNRNECLRFELASWYWHFVDVVWIFLYFILYYINN